jgi:hypothetical protein
VSGKKGGGLLPAEQVLEEIPDRLEYIDSLAGGFCRRGGTRCPTPADRAWGTILARDVAGYRAGPAARAFTGTPAGSILPARRPAAAPRCADQLSCSVGGISGTFAGRAFLRAVAAARTDRFVELASEAPAVGADFPSCVIDTALV